MVRIVVSGACPGESTRVYLENRSLLDAAEPLALPGEPSRDPDGRYAITLDDDWLADHDVRSGDVVEMFQSTGGRRSPSVLVVFDDVGGMPRNRLLRVRLAGFWVQLRAGKIHVSSRDALAIEPSAKIRLGNLRTGQLSRTCTVAEDGAFALWIVARAGDPIVVRLVDHAHDFGDPQFERRLTLAAGRDQRPMLADNPSFSAGSPPVLGRCELIDGGRVIAGVATPGCVVSSSRADLPDGAVHTVADAEGAFRLPVPLVGRAKHATLLEVRNPFALDERYQNEGRQRATFALRVRVSREGTLLVDGPGGELGAVSGGSGTGSESVLRSHAS